MSVVAIETKTRGIIKVVSAENEAEYVGEQDAEMDLRAKEAVKNAIEKAKFCKKPVAKYDPRAKKAYVEYPNGEKRYVD